jgi:2-methylisocitrate lyase-like PEP mutase family enzyme
MSPNFQSFQQLHQSGDLFVLPNAWNPQSAKLLQEKKFSAIATSSAAVAQSLGYEDGEAMPFWDYLFIVTRILSSIRVPLSVDMEMGYGSSDAEIFDNLRKLIDLGVAGINIEDSVITGGVRALKEATAFARTVAFIRDKLAAARLDCFINIRCDTFLLDVPNKQQETNDRMKLYESAGADGIFLPCIVKEQDIVKAVNATTLPVNVMCFPGLPNFDVLHKLGVKRVSLGPFLFSKVYGNIDQYADAIAASNNLSSIL